MTNLTEQQLLARAAEIAEMGEITLSDFAVKLSLSNLNDKAKYYLYEAIDKRQEQLNDYIPCAVERGEMEIGIEID